VLINYSPTRILYVSEPLRKLNCDLTDDRVVFHVAGVGPMRLISRLIWPPQSSKPATPTGLPTRRSTFEADFYIANRGNNTIVHMRQHRTVVAIRRAICRRAPARGPPGSSDGTKIWVTVTGHLAGAGYLVGAVLERPRF